MKRQLTNRNNNKVPHVRRQVRHRRTLFPVYQPGHRPIPYIQAMEELDQTLYLISSYIISRPSRSKAQNLTVGKSDMCTFAPPYGTSLYDFLAPIHFLFTGGTSGVTPRYSGQLIWQPSTVI